MRMDDFETSFKKCKIDKEICKNDTMTGSANISPTTIKEDDTSVINTNFKMTCTPTTSTDEECTKQHGTNISMTMNPISSQQGGTELFLITNMTNSLITITIPSESSEYV